MSITGDRRAPTVVASSVRLGAAKRGWSWPHYLAMLGVPILVWNAWTVVAWLADGPHQIVQFRESHTANWYAARVYEGMALLITVLVSVYVVRGCIRARRVLTFDVMFCLAGATAFWNDLGGNVFQPAFLTSSNFVNLNNTCGHMPFVINPDCGRAPDPILFLFLLLTFGILGCTTVVAAALRCVRSRRPDLSTAQLVAIVLIGGVFIELLVEPPAIALGLWTYNLGPFSLRLGNGLRYSLTEAIAGGLFFGMVVAVRVFKDDKGHTVLERGLDQHRPAVRKAISFLALYAWFQIALWGVGTIPLWVAGAYQGPWPTIPRYLVNEVCDAPGFHGTRYGICPGDPGFRLPGRQSLAGHSPSRARR